MESEQQVIKYCGKDVILISPIFSGVKLHSHSWNVAVRFIFSSIFANLICRGTDFSKCFRESLGFRDDESQLYLKFVNHVYKSDTNKMNILYKQQTRLYICIRPIAYQFDGIILQSIKKYNDSFLLSIYFEDYIKHLYLQWDIPVSILHKSIAGRYRPVRVADGPITARYRFM